MKWKYVKELKTTHFIDEYERLVKYVFCESFRNCVIINNGGRPDRKIFDTDKVKERELKSFLSFNKEDRETVWKIFEWNKKELANRYIPFGIDHFGNLICFDADTDKVVFVNHEDLSTESIAENFDSFLDGLYAL